MRGGIIDTLWLFLTRQDSSLNDYRPKTRLRFSSWTIFARLRDRNRFRRERILGSVVFVQSYTAPARQSESLLSRRRAIREQMRMLFTSFILVILNYVEKTFFRQFVLAVKESI